MLKDKNLASETETTTKANTLTDSGAQPATSDAGEAQVQESFDKANEQGFFGVEVDKTDNKAYTLAGVTSNMPTPETEKVALDSEARNSAKTGVSSNKAQD